MERILLTWDYTKPLPGEENKLGIDNNKIAYIQKRPSNEA